jgi:hypothetical protein
MKKKKKMQSKNYRQKSPVFMEKVICIDSQHFLFTKLTYNYCIPFHQLENEMK